MAIPNTLNEKQKEAVLLTEGPLLIVAGAGAGKTKTITHRIAYMIEKGVRPSSILAVTFTNKAAGEMRERVRALLPTDLHGTPLVCTFHSLCVRILREFHVDAMLPRAFVLWDRDDSAKSIKRALDRLDLGQWTPRSMLSAISREKGEAANMRDYAERATMPRERAIAAVWEIYDAELRREGALDFDDLIARALILLRESERVRSLLQNRWHYITVDEYQDTNRTQYEIVRLLAGDRKNVCVVGDTDQSIYSWRGAEMEHLLNFEDAFPGAHVVLLEQNYRSTRTIIAAANGVIARNTKRHAKNLFTENQTGDPIHIYAGGNEVDEAWYIAQTIQKLIKEGIHADEIAILYRENFQSRVLEEACLGFGVPYRVLGTKFYERKEVKDVLSFIRAAMNTESRADFARAASAVPRGIGKVTIDKVFEGGEASLTGAAKIKIDTLRTILNHIYQACITLPASEAVRFALETSGVESSLGQTDEGKERLENVHELVNLAVRYDEFVPPEGVERLMEDAALESDQDELTEKRPEVALMTIHASKGLEFDVVFVTGLEQGLFPSIREGTRDPEEERRLFYVALTRARKTLHLTHAKQRMKYGSREFALRSEFIGDIDTRLVAAPPKRGLLDDIYLD
jgi:DNA helicase-2/ATP-dependent DNA helicase PcrA